MDTQTAGLHPLDRWRRDRDWTLESLAAALEVNVATVSRYISGRRKPEDAVMARIFAVTEGAVQPNDFYRLPARGVLRQAQDEESAP